MILSGLDTTVFSAEPHMHAPKSRCMIRLTVPLQLINKRLKMVYRRPGPLHFVPIPGSFIVHLLDGLRDFLLL